LADDLREPPLAFGERFSRQILSIEMDQIEGVEDDCVAAL
jgi:hypothetical protein